MNTFRISATALVILLFLTSSLSYGARSVTLYPDGAMIEQQETAKKGYLEITLPFSARVETLRITPSKGVELLNVTTTPQKPAKNVDKELSQLLDREEMLKDRLRALSVREEIFKSAAKSQSAKSPKRTKTNPEPLTVIKKGTDYAISQLEAVYSARRKAENEISQIEARRKKLASTEQSGGTVVKVWLSKSAGGVTASWMQGDRNWIPSYQLRTTSSGKASIAFFAQSSSPLKGEKTYLALNPGSSEQFSYNGDMTLLKIAEFQQAAAEGSASSGSPLVTRFSNSLLFNLPPGALTCFNNGSYVGNGRFEGVEQGKSIDISCNNR